MSKRKYIWITTLIILLCALLLSQVMNDATRGVIRNNGVGGQGGELPEELPSQEERQLELHVAVFMEADEFQLLTDWNRLHETNNPGMTFHLTNVSKAQLYSDFKHALAGNEPDIVQLDNTWVTELAALGLLSHRAAEQLEADRYVANVLNQLRWNGYLWAVPRDIDPYITLLNMSMLNGEDGLRIPASPADWLYEYERLAEPNGAAAPPFMLDEYDPLAIVSAVWAVGGDWNAGEEKTIGLADADGLGGALELLVGGSAGQPFFRHSPGAPIGADGGQALAAVVRLSDWLRSRSANDALTLHTNGDETGLWLAGTSLAVSSRSEHAAEAFAWINAMTEQTRQLQLMRQHGKLPVFQEAYDTVDFRMLPQAERIREAMAGGRTFAADAQLLVALDSIRAAWQEWKTAGVSRDDADEQPAVLEDASADEI